MSKPAASSDIYATVGGGNRKVGKSRLFGMAYGSSYLHAVRETLSLKRQSSMFSAQTRKDFATRGLVSDNTLALLSRARGLDLLQRDEQFEYRVDAVESKDLVAAAQGIRPELGEYLHLEWDAEHAAVVHKLDQVNYPVPGYAGYDAS